MPKNRIAIVGCLVLAACSSGDSPDAATLAVTGSADVPGGSPPFWIVVEGQGGAHLGAGASDASGRFELAVARPDEGAVVLALAVDPDAPEHMAIAAIELMRPRSSGADVVAPPAVIDARSTSEVLLRDARGGTAAVAGDDDAARLDAMARSLEQTAPPMCSGSVGGEVAAALVAASEARVPTVRGRFDQHVAGAGTLLERLRAAQGDITDSVASANQFNTYQVLTLGMNGMGGIHRTRWNIAALTGLPTDGLTRELTKNQLEVASQVSLDVGWGNCREKGMLGAYAASRFPEIKQIAVVGIESSKYRGSHAVAIACAKDSTVYDLDTYGSSLESDALYPAKMIEAECIVIDPWVGTTDPVTRELIEREKWTLVLDVAIVRDASPALPPPTVFEPCMKEGDGRRCEPFPLPTKPVDEPPSQPGFELLGGCGNVEDFFCANFYGHAASREQIQGACQEGNTWYATGCPASGAYGSCVLHLTQAVYYTDPDDDDPAQTAVDARTECESIPPEGGGPGRWVAPYTGPN